MLPIIRGNMNFKITIAGFPSVSFVSICAFYHYTVES